MVTLRKVVSEDGRGGSVTRRLNGAAFGKGMSRGLVGHPAKDPVRALVVEEIEDWGIVAVTATALVKWRRMCRQDLLIGGEAYYSVPGFSLWWGPPFSLNSGKWIWNAVTSVTLLSLSSQTQSVTWPSSTIPE